MDKANSFRRGVFNQVVKAAKKLYDETNTIVENTISNIPKELKPVETKCIVFNKRVNVYSIDALSAFGYDRNTFIQVGTNYKNIVRNLSNRAFKLFSYIEDNIKWESNSIELTTNKVKDIIQSKYSQHVSACIKELIDAKVINKTNTKYLYEVNVNIIFKGSYFAFCFKYNQIYNNPIINNI